jgi:purine nucleoside phosphorylase
LAQAEIGIIGGSGLYNMPGLSEIHEVRQETPFGEPEISRDASLRSWRGMGEGTGCCRLS